MANETQGRSSVVDLVSTVVILATCAFLVYANWTKLYPPSRTPPVPTAAVALDDAALKGDASAPVVLLEWSDYECPYCGKAEREVLPAIHQQYIATGRVQLAFFHHPLSIHPKAAKAAEAAVCAGREGKFWEMQASLFEDPKNLDTPELYRRAKLIGVDDTRFTACMAGEATSRVVSNSKSAEAFGLTSTPSFLVGRRQADGRVKIDAVLIGAKSSQEFAQALDRSLAGGQPASSSMWLAAAAVGIAGGLALFAWTRRPRVRLDRLASQ